MTRELADGIAYLNAIAIPRCDLLTAATGTFTVPANVTEVEVEAFAGGGGGGAGGSGDHTSVTTRSAPGGGGGGASRVVRTKFTGLTPGAVINYANGVGGAGGAGVTGAGNAGLFGTHGSDSTFDAVVVARGAGEGAGGNGPYTNNAAPLYAFTPGGKSVRPTNSTVVNQMVVAQLGALLANPYEGGQGGLGGTITGQVATDGGASAEGFVGGAAGAPGGTVTDLGGGGGGGGAGGPGGVGAAGGAGGVGSTGANATPTAPSPAAANTGAGGGGGGGSGQSLSGSAPGAAGSAGGSGAMRIFYFGTQAVFT